MWENYGYPDLLPIPGPTLAVVLATLYVLSLACLSIGWRTRTSAIIATVLTADLGMLDTIGTLTKYTCIATHVLLLLSVSECGVAVVRRRVVEPVAIALAVGGRWRLPALGPCGRAAPAHLSLRA